MKAKYALGTAENVEFLTQMRNDMFRFGCQFPSPDGACYYLGDDGTPWKERDLETYETARMLHVYVMASLLGYEEGENLAAAALHGLRTVLHDDTHG